MAKDAPMFSPSQSALVKSLKNTSNPKYYYQPGHRDAGMPKPAARKKLRELANYKLEVSAGRPPDAAEDHGLREERPDEEMLGQYWIEHTPQKFEGEPPRLGYLETKALLERMPIAERERVLGELAARG